MPNLFVQKIPAKKNAILRNTFQALAIGLSFFLASLNASAANLDSSLNEEVVMMPAGSGASSVQLETTIFKPPGEGPFPLVIMNHGKALGSPRNQTRDRFLVVSKEFVKRGYAVVIPMRKGFSKSTGEYADRGCDMTGHGLAQAEDLQGALEYLTMQSWVDKDRILVAGQSYGGLTAMAFGTHAFPGVRGLINFAGGLKVHGGGCQWKSSLVNAFAEYGSKTTLPSLWFYGENDHHFDHELASRLYEAYTKAGGHANLVAYGPFKKDAHGMVGSHDGVKVWWPETEKFLKEIGMPTEQVVALSDENRIPKTDYAALDDVNAVPYLKEKGREQYKVFLSKSYPRAFAISPSGAWSWAEDGDDPVEQVLATCRKSSSQPCKLYAVNDNVVWDGEPMLADSTQPGSVEKASALTGP